MFVVSFSTPMADRSSVSNLVFIHKSTIYKIFNTNSLSIKVSGKTGVVYSDLVHSSNGESHVAAAASVLSHKSIEIEVSNFASVCSLQLSLSPRPFSTVLILNG